MDTPRPIPTALEPGTITVVPGCDVMAWIGTDGELVVQIDTPVDGPFRNLHVGARVYLNDARAIVWSQD